MTLIESQRSLMEQALITLKEIEVLKQCFGIFGSDELMGKIGRCYEQYSDLMVQLSRTFHSGVVHQSSEWVEPR